jgi:preprotein translocase subunit SecA
MNAVGFSDETPIEAKMISASIGRAQSKVENHNYEIRKSVLEYDDVMNKQREVIYAERRRVLRGESLRDFMLETLADKASQAVDQNAPDNVHPSEWDLEEILNEMELICPMRNRVSVEDLEKLDRDGMKVKLTEAATAAYEAKEAELGADLMRVIESQYIMLPIIDRLWVDHLYIMDALKTGIGLRGYGQKDPRVEYEKEAYEIFEDLKGNIADEAINSVFRVVVERQDEATAQIGEAPSPYGAQNGAAFEPVPQGALAPAEAEQAAPQHARLDPAYAQALLGPMPGAEKRELHTNREEEAPKKPVKSADKKVGRNELCPCGSGKKYKRCHGVVA